MYGYDWYPLLLKQDCPLIEAGGGYIGAYPLLRGKITGSNGVPDYNMADIGFHYPPWNFKEFGSGEILLADLDGSMAVDFTDFAALANYWLQPAEGGADIDCNGFVDYDDLSLLADDWLRSEEIHIEGYSFDTHQTVDFNNVSGSISIGPRNIPSNVDEVFIYVDDVEVGRWVRGYYEWNGFFESEKFANGQHTIKVVSINRDGDVMNYRPMNTYFNNLLYKVSADERFYPTRNYYFRGYYDGQGYLDVNLTDLNDTVIWSNTYSGSYIDINIPGEAFGAETLCKINISDNNGFSLCASSIKEFRKEDIPSNVKALVIAPTNSIRNARGPAIKAYKDACKKHRLTYQELYDYDVNEANLTELLTRDSVKYVYWTGHADCNVVSKDKKTIVRRTYTNCWDVCEKWPHVTDEIFVFSQTDVEPPLPDNWDYRGVNLSTMNVGGKAMHDSSKKKIVFIDGCSSALSYKGGINDMAEAYGMNSLEGLNSLDQVYIGWKIPVGTAIWDEWSDDLTDWVKLFWDRMGSTTDNNSVGHALEWTAEHPPNSKGWEKMWGENKTPNFFDVGGDDNIFIWGHGTINFHQIRLEP